MQKILKRLILLLLIAVIAMAVVACSPDQDNGDKPSGGGNAVEPGTQPSVNKSVIFADIKEGLINAGNRIDQVAEGTRHVTSAYTLRANKVNVAVRYEANYNLTRREDSEVLLDVHNYETEETTAFIYYKDNDLYYVVGGKGVKIEKFGTTSSFDFLYDTITMCDLASVIYSESFAENIESMSAAAESNKIVRHNLDENSENITVTDVNLDRLKGTINDFITANITSLGTRLDALSNLFLGIDISELGKVEVGLFTAKKLMTVLEKISDSASAVSRFDIEFEGMQTNNIDDYYFGASYATSEKNEKISPRKSVDPFNPDREIDYISESYGEVYMTGTVKIPYISSESEFYLDLRSDLNSLDNSANKMAALLYDRPLTGSADIDENIKVIATGHYTGGKLYLDLTELINIYFGNVVDFPALGMPKVRFDNIDISRGLRKLTEYAMDVIASGIDLSGAEVSDERLNVLISKIRSDKGVFYITIDAEFVSGVLGSDNAAVVDYIASALGIESKYVSDILALGIADNMSLEIAYDTINGKLGITVRNGETVILEADLTIHSVTNVGLEIRVPTEAELDTYGQFVTPSVVSVKISGEFGAQGNERNDISALMGLLIGDITGKNTPCLLRVTDKITLDGYFYETLGHVYISLTIAVNGEPYAIINSDPNDYTKLYIDNRMLGVRYIIDRDIITGSVDGLTGSDIGIGWNDATIAAVYALMVNNGSIRLEKDSLIVSLVASKGQGSDNLLLNLLGVDAFSGSLKLSVSFAAPEIELNTDTYYVPSASVYNPETESLVSEAVWSSIYEAVWYDKAAVAIGDVVLILELNYTEESSRLETGVYEYHPTAKLFGQNITYAVYFTDNVNGTSVVGSLAEYSLVIDPSLEAPFAETVSVIYNNGRYGELPYVIEYEDGRVFPYNNNNARALINGIAPATYRLVIGKGSIAEKSFAITMTVLCRTLRTANASENYNGVPIVAKVTIDPYEYSQRKLVTEAAGGRYYPIRYRDDDPSTPDVDESTLLYLNFNPYPGSTKVDTVKIAEFDWGFNEGNITAKGGEYPVIAKYNTIDIAMIVTVLAKEVDYIKINDESENYYTVDSLVKSTYVIPTATNAENEVRIYFKSGKYRIIGQEPEDYVKTDPLCDGYYYISTLQWDYGVADYVTLDRSVNPLNNGRDNVATAKFGDDIVGKKEVTLHVVCPTRVLQSRREGVRAIISVNYASDGSIIEERLEKDTIFASQASFTKYGSVNDSYFYFDPYSSADSNLYLPDVIYADVMYRGVLTRRAYPVKWLEGLNGQNDNIIEITENGRGKIKNAFAEESYLRVYGRIGDGELTQVVTMLILNRSGSYEHVVMRNADDSLYEGVKVYNYDSNGQIIPEGNTTTEVAFRRYYLEHLNPYDKLNLPEKFTLVFNASSGIPDSTYTANWKTDEDGPIAEFVPDAEGRTYVIHTSIMGESDTGMLDQIIELYLSFDQKRVVKDRIYGIYAEADSAVIPTYSPEGSSEKIPYVEINTYSIRSNELYESLVAGINSVGIGFLDGTASSDVAIEWLNLNEFLEVLKSPLGSDDYYHPGQYPGNIIFLKGKIAPGTSLEQEVKMGFRVNSRVLTGMNFNNLTDEFKTPDEDGIIPVELSKNMVRYYVNNGVLETSDDKNEIIIKFNKYYTLRGSYVNEFGVMTNGLCSPSQYIKYLFGSVSLSFADSALVNALHYTLRDDFDQIVYGNVVPVNDPTVIVNSNEIIIKETVEKITDGSCVRRFAVTFIFKRDYLAESDYSIGVETFDPNGNPLYETQEGYLIPTVFGVEYAHSGVVEYDDLVWHAESTEYGVNQSTITAGQVVRNIRYEFFRFAQGRTINLYTDLPGGQRITLRVHFYAKNVNYTSYSTEGNSLYKIVNGTLTIANVYDIMPVTGLVGNLSTTIIPNATMQFESPYAMHFELIDGWHPAVDFEDGNGGFSYEALKSSITSRGLPKQLFAYGMVRGYNNEKQRINLYIEVVALDAGVITHNQYNIVANGLKFDPYSSDTYDGNFVLPRDITVTFGKVFHKFVASDGVTYELRSASMPYTYTPVTALTYNSIGHTMGAEYGAPNAELYLRVTLPDGNSGLNFRVTFPNRQVEQVSYAVVGATGTQTQYIANRYYIDPYNAATFTLPSKAVFRFPGEANGVEYNVSWTPYGNAQEAFAAVGGKYRYKGGDYGGADYLFTTTLRSFDEVDEEQIIVMYVVVLDRMAQSIPAEFGTPVGGKYSYKIDKPFTTYVSDIPYTLVASDFIEISDKVVSHAAMTAALNDIFSEHADARFSYDSVLLTASSAVYNDYLAVATPSVPVIKWYKTVDVASGTYVPFTDDDISIMGFFTQDASGITVAPKSIIGIIESGTGADIARGQQIDMTFSADYREFLRIEIDSEHGNTTVIEFNPYTMASSRSSFDVHFAVKEDPTSSSYRDEVITFYPEYYADTPEKRRALMIFNTNDWVGGTSSITLRCEGKNLPANSFTTDRVYRLDAQQIGIDEISFGYGANDGYAVSGLVELVIDPLNPVIPTKAFARGKIMNGSGEVIDLGEVDVTWDNAIYNIPLSGGNAEIAATATKAGEIAEIMVRVTYLDRTPQNILTTESGFTTAANPVDDYFTLMSTTFSGTSATRNHHMTIDPINTSIFRYEGDTNVYYNTINNNYTMSRYILPSTLHIVFANDYSDNATVMAALDKLGASLDLIDIEWRLSRDISLVGTLVEGGAITARIARFRVRNGDYVSEKYDFMSAPGRMSSTYNLLLSTVNRQVEYTSISSVPENADINYQKAFAEYYIDPYDIKFPNTISIKFTGSVIEEVYNDIEWEYDEDYLKRTDVISGNIDPSFMFVMGTMKIYGTELSIQFAIKARKINITVVLPSGEQTSAPLSGGTIYVRKGVPIEEQLPTHLYYRFDYADNTSQVAAVPLKFSAGNINNLDSVQAGATYTGVSATLGTVDSDNITFTIIVIDPKLYIVNEETTSVTVGNITNTNTKYSNGGFYYDYISIGVNRAGQYVPGPEVSLLPDKVIISEDGAYMDIVDINYNLDKMEAEIRCRYTFLSFSDSPNLSGDIEGDGKNSDKMELTFTVPLRTYDYTTLEARTVEFATNSIRFPVGHTVTASDMPETLNGVQPLWTFNNLNQNRAGEYVATCTYKNAYGEILTGSITVIFERKSITADDIVWNPVGNVNFLNRVYTGSPLNVYDFITISDFLRHDGSMGQLEHFSVQYSIDGGINWQDEQPLAVRLEGAPNYRVRISVRDSDDYNVTGYVIYSLNITKCEIKKEDIFYYNNNGEEVHFYQKGSENSIIGQVEYYYTGREMTPVLGGIPEGATYELVYATYDPELGTYIYNRVIRPVNVGEYQMQMSFSLDQRNYMFTDERFVVKIKIKKPDISATLRIKDTMEYNGTYRDAIVEGLPEGSSDIRLEFSYFNIDTNTPVAVGAQIREAGNYRVTVKLYGGNNWPSYNTEDGESLQSLFNQPVTITKRRVIVDIGTVESEYLDELKPMNSSISFRYAENTSEAGLVGTDTIQIFGNMQVRWSGGELTYKHMVGSYPLVFVSVPTHKNYDIVTVNNGYYNIVARMQGAVIINDVEELRAAVATLRDGYTRRWYLRAGNYGDLVINRNASVSIIGSYDLSSEEENVAVYFDSITVTSGDVNLDIVAFNAKASASSVYVANSAGTVSISRSSFTRTATNTLVDSVGVRIQYGYQKTVDIRDSLFEGYKTAVYMESGTLNVVNSTFKANSMGVNIVEGALTLNNNYFYNTRGAAVYIGAQNATLSIFDNEFCRNVVAINSNTPLRNDIDVQNTFSDNAEDFAVGIV